MIILQALISHVTYSNVQVRFTELIKSVVRQLQSGTSSLQTLYPIISQKIVNS